MAAITANQMQESMDCYSSWIQKERYMMSSKTGKLERYWVVIHKETKEAYRGVPPVVISTLALFIFAALPVYFIAMVSWHVMTTIAYLIQDIGKIPEACRKSTLSNKLIEIILDVSKGIKRVVRDCFHSIAMGTALLYTVLCPYDGRALVSKIEKSWHEGFSKEHDLRKLTNKPDGTFDNQLEGELINKAFLDKNSTTVFYLAYCFQPLSNQETLNFS